jgi:hypothetical protein
VDLPAPFGPTMAKISPELAIKSAYNKPIPGAYSFEIL